MHTLLNLLIYEYNCNQNYLTSIFLEDSLICNVNEKGTEPKQVACQPPFNKFCNYIDREGVVTRNCSAGEGLWPKVRCIKMSKFTSCLCKGDNCNNQCDWDNCTKIATSRSVKPNEDIAIYNCNANCNAEGNQ